MLRVVVLASWASSSMRYSPDAAIPCGWTAASNSCDTAVSMTSRELLRICLGARRRPPRMVEIAPAGCRGCLAADISGRRRDRRRGGVVRHGLVVAESEVPHLTKILCREARVHRCVEPVLRQIPAAAPRHPGRLGEPLLDPPVVAPLHVRA